jgi:hypothetical protein
MRTRTLVTERQRSWYVVVVEEEEEEEVVVVVVVEEEALRSKHVPRCTPQTQPRGGLGTHQRGRGGERGRVC